MAHAQQRRLRTPHARHVEVLHARAVREAERARLRAFERMAPRGVVRCAVVRRLDREERMARIVLLPHRRLGRALRAQVVVCSARARRGVAGATSASSFTGAGGGK